jgi:hypothetical protein
MSPGQLGDALSTLAQSNIVAGGSLAIDLTSTAKALEYSSWSGNGRPGSVHRIVSNAFLIAVGSH